MKLKIKTEQVIAVDDWDKLVEETYGRPYKFQQQDGCRSRGTFKFKVPDKELLDFENDEVKEEVNGPEEGVSFAAWLARDPKKQIPERDEDYVLELWWHRNFYPDVSMVANDLHKKGLLPEGDYTIDIDW